MELVYMQSIILPHEAIYNTHNLKLFSTSILTFKENLSDFFPWDLPVVKISPEWVTGPEQGKSSGRIAAFSLWTGPTLFYIYIYIDEIITE